MKNPKMFVAPVYETEIDKIVKILKENPPKIFKGTMDVYQYTWNKKSAKKIMFNTLSCFSCNLGSKCTHYFKGELNYDTENTNKSRETIITPSKNFEKSKVNLKINLNKKVDHKLTTSRDNSQIDNNSGDCETVLRRISGRKRTIVDYKNFFE